MPEEDWVGGIGMKNTRMKELDILGDISTSFWLAEAIRSCRNRDIVDVLRKLMVERFEEIKLEESV